MILQYAVSQRSLLVFGSSEFTEYTEDRLMNDCVFA